MTPTNWSYSPNAAREAWRAWQKQTNVGGTSEAFMAGVEWALGQKGRLDLLEEIATLQKRVRDLERRPK